MADALSRLPQYNSSKPNVVLPLMPSKLDVAQVTTRAGCKAKLLSHPNVSHDIMSALPTDDWYIANKDLCIMRDGLPYHGDKLYVPSTLRPTVLKLTHDDKTAGHFGFVKTLHLLKRQFWWPSLKKDVESYVKSCPTCASSKKAPGKPRGLLQSVANPSFPWEEISMDFIVELPESAGNTVIWVVTDLFSKQVHFVPLPKIPSAKTLAKLFVQHVYRLHGAPKRVISDRGVQFTSKFWKAFLALLGSSPALSSAHHPQTNGACERTNSVLEQYLRCYLNYQQDNWTDLLPFAEIAYNNSVHSSTGFTPFKIVHGRDFVAMPSLPSVSTGPTSLQHWIDQLSSTWPLLSTALVQAHEDHKKFADRKRSPEIPYQIGDLVYLSTKFLATTQKSKKLGPKFVGPFPIVRIINRVTVQLKLPKSMSRIHPVFHVHLLKPACDSPLRAAAPPPPLPLLIDGEQHFEIKEILDSRKRRNRLQYLVAWKHFPISAAEWVNDTDVRAPDLVRDFHTRYPHKP